MKFCIYEVREDERQMLETLRQKYDLELILTSQPLNLETASLAAGCDGVSTPVSYTHLESAGHDAHPF